MRVQVSARLEWSTRSENGTVSEVERTGIVLIRVWLECDDAERGLRARISLVRDVRSRETEEAVAATPAGVLEAVREFVDEFVAGGVPPHR
jgi:hypothetical protein